MTETVGGGWWSVRMKLGSESRRSDWASFVHSSHFKAPVNDWAGVSQHFICTKRERKRVQREAVFVHDIRE